MTRRPLVVDASVVVKWVVPEEHSGLARSLYRDCIRQGTPLASPPHLLGEMVNALYQRLRTTDAAKHLSRTKVDRAVSRILRVPFELHQPADLYERALDLAATHRLPGIYDALYVVLAQMLGAELWTADRRLLTALAGATPWVRDIASYPSVS